MACGDTGIGGQRVGWQSAVSGVMLSIFRRLFEAQRGVRIEEAIGKHADMQRPCEAGKHDSQSSPVSNHGRKRAKFGGRGIERL